MTRRVVAITLLAVVAGGPGRPADAADLPAYEAYAVRYATLANFPVAALVRGAEPARKLDIAMTVWVLKGPEGRVVLVDSGFYRPKLLKEWKSVTSYTRPDKALARLGIRPEDVTDVIITHAHWDHADGADLFPKAKVWIQKAEYDHYAAAAQPPEGVDDHLAALVKLNAAGRVGLVAGDSKEILPGVTVYTGGRHTFESQYVGVRTRAGTMVLASDNVYLYENLDKHVPIAQTFDAVANLAAQDRMKRIASNPKLIIPGHDPEVFARYPEPGDGVARLD